MPPSGVHSKQHAAIRHSIKALHHHRALLKIPLFAPTVAYHCLRKWVLRRPSFVPTGTYHYLRRWVLSRSLFMPTGPYPCSRQRALSIPSFTPTGAQHTIVCANERSGYHHLHQQLLSIPLFALTGAQHTINCTDGHSAEHRAAIEHFLQALCRHWALDLSTALPSGTSHCTIAPSAHLQGTIRGEQARCVVFAPAEWP